MVKLVRKLFARQSQPPVHPLPAAAVNRHLDRMLKALRPRSTRRVVYTCLFGYSETFADRLYPRDGVTDYVCFTDDRSLTSRLWQFRYIDATKLGPVKKAAKMVKILPHRFVGDYGSSLYIDNTVELTAPPSKLVSFLNRSKSPMVCFRHPDRDCVLRRRGQGGHGPRPRRPRNHRGANGDLSGHRARGLSRS